MGKKDQDLAARKELLRMRSEMERLEMRAWAQRSKSSASWFLSTKKAASVALSAIGFLRYGPVGFAAAQAIKAVYKKAPQAGLVASLTLAVLKRPAIRRFVTKAGVGVLFAGGLALLCRRASHKAPRLIVINPENENRWNG